MIKKLIISSFLASISFANITYSQDVIFSDRSSFGKVVRFQAESTTTDIQLELSIGDYKNEPITNYSDRSALAEFGKSVGRLDVLTDKGHSSCTAFIISNQYILTNYHCSIGILENDRLGASRIDAINFVTGYIQTGVKEGTRTFTVVPTPVEISKPLDYAVLEVIGDPSAVYGELKLASLPPQSGDPFWIIGHPMGEGQRVSREGCRAGKPAVSEGRLLHTCDTLPGNSGSPVIDVSLRQVIALHHAGSKKDSVNFAIPMSEILSNSKVLAAYLAPELKKSAETKKGNETQALAPCDVLYEAAREAEACYAYSAYIKNCKNHTLAPIAKGYMEEFCQAKTLRGSTKLDQNRPKCSIVNLSVCSDQELCEIGTRYSRSAKKWGGTPYISEAKKRGLTCGINKKQTTTVQKSCSVSSLENCTDQTLCGIATYEISTKPTITIWSSNTKNLSFVVEARRRGLTCGVAKTAVATQKLTITSEPVNKQRPKLRSRQNPTQPTCSIVNLSVCSGQELCEIGTMYSGNARIWAGTPYIAEAQKRGLTCGVAGTTARQLTNLPLNIRRSFSRNFAGGFYAAVHGDWSIFAEDQPIRQCFVTSKPIKSLVSRDGKKVNMSRYEILLWVNYRASGINGQIIFTGGYRKDPAKLVELDINGVKFFLVPHGKQAWPANRAEGKRIIMALKGGGTATLTANTTWGTTTQDTFSLKGLAQAVNEASKRCSRIPISTQKLTITSEPVNKQRPKLRSRQNPTQPTCSIVDLSICNDQELCEIGTINSGNTRKWAGTPYITEAKKRSLSCGMAETVVTPKIALSFKKPFTSQPKLRRQQIQYALRKMKFYKGAIDGLHGSKTEKALVSYAKTINFVDSKALFKNLLSQVKVPKSFETKTVGPASTGPKTGIPVNISVNWRFDIACSRGRVRGRVKVSNRKNEVNGKVTYNVFYKNNLGGRYKGWLVGDGRKISIHLRQTNGSRETTYGDGRFNASFSSLSGTMDDGCKFIGTPTN